MQAEHCTALEDLNMWVETHRDPADSCFSLATALPRLSLVKRVSFHVTATHTPHLSSQLRRELSVQIGTGLRTLVTAIAAVRSARALQHLREVTLNGGGDQWADALYLQHGIVSQLVGIHLVCM